jgi:hypothetical protein
VKLVRTQKEKYIVLLEKEEKPLLLSLLRRYPLVPAAHQPLSKYTVSAQSEADQRLLDEALAEQRLENQRQLQQLLKEPRRLRKVAAGWHLALSASDFEWLLQVLNDVRVGSWISLGAPEKDLLDFEMNEQTAVPAWTMELAGYFQAQLLAVIQGGHA